MNQENTLDRKVLADFLKYGLLTDGTVNPNTLNSLERYIKKQTQKAEVRGRKIIEKFYDDSPCRFDHHGYCQEHLAGEIDQRCTNLVAKEYLGLQSEREL
jgi:hypothetical protein